MKLLIVSQYFWPESFRINEVVQALVGRGIEVDVLTGKPNYPEGKIFDGYRMLGCQHQTWQGATIYRVPLLERGMRNAPKLALNYLSFVVSASLFGSWVLRGKKYDAILVYAPSPILQALPALWIGRLLKCPVAVWVQDLWPESLVATGHITNRRALGWVSRLVRFIYRKTDLILIQSRAFEANVAALAGHDRIAYFPNSADSSFSRGVRMECPAPLVFEGCFSILFAGNVGSVQAVDVIIEAATLLRNEVAIRFVILGSGSRWEWMREEIELRGLTNVHLLGRYPVETMPSFMQKASVLLVTLADKPILAGTVPSKIQAYLASGRPLLASINGEGARLIQEAGAGIAVPAEDARALADAAIRLSRLSLVQLNALGENGRQYFLDRFDHDKLISQLIGTLGDLSIRGSSRDASLNTPEPPLE